MIELRSISITLGSFALRDVSFSIPAGNYGVLMGQTGCGKTTLLEAIAGLRRVAAGVIKLNNIDVTHLFPAERGIGYVPQDLALFPTMTVREHLAFALTVRRWSQPAIDQRVKELADLLHIAPLLSRSLVGLSGGEQQRIALGRALSFRPRLLLMDEPLSALDESTRRQMYDLLKRVQKHEHVTALHVTHSSEEAAALADCVLRLESGVIRIG